MVRSYKKKSDRLSWSKDQMLSAVDLVVKEGQCLKNVASQFGIPRSTLQRKVNIFNKNPSADQDNNILKVSGFTPIFTAEQEQAFSREITRMENMLIPLTSIDMRKLAFQFADKLQIPHHFNKETDYAASNRDDFLSSSTTTNSESEARITGFRDILRDIMDSNAQNNSKEESNTSQPSMQSSSKDTNAESEVSIMDFNAQSTPKKKTDTSQQSIPSSSEIINAEGEVRIPLSYIMQTKPLINLLSLCLNSSTGYVPLEKFMNNSDHPIELTLPVLSQMPPQLQNQPVQATVNPATHSMIQDDSSLPTSQKARKGRVKGKAAIITQDKYREDLMAEKIKNIKKEKAQETSNSVQEANVPLPTTSKALIPKPQKRKQPSTKTAPKKRKPLADLNNQLNNNATPLFQEPILPIITSESLPLQDNEYVIQVDDNNDSNPLVQNYFYYINENDLKNLNL